MKIEIIDDARRLWRMFSVQAMALSIAVQGAWSAFSDDLKQYIPHGMISAISIGLLFIGIGGRMVKQPTPPCPPKDGAT